MSVLTSRESRAALLAVISVVYLLLVAFVCKLLWSAWVAYGDIDAFARLCSVIVVIVFCTVFVVRGRGQ